jgi:hypothetical protein
MSGTDRENLECDEGGDWPARGPGPPPPTYIVHTNILKVNIAETVRCGWAAVCNVQREEMIKEDVACSAR